MKNVKELKQNVLQRMRFCWGENAAIFFITVGGAAAMALVWFMIMDLLASLGITDSSARRVDLSNGTVIAVTAVSLLILFGIAEPFRYGVKWYRLQQVRGNSVHAGSMFSCYSSWKRAGQIFRLNAYLFAKRFYFTAPLAIMFAAGIFLVNKIETSGNTVAYSAAAVLVFLLTGSIACAAAAFNCRYAAVTYLFVLEPDTPPKELVEKGLRISKGKSDYLVNAVLSSSLCLPFCVLIFPMVFAVPYLQMVYTAAVNEIIMSDRSEDNDGLSGKQGYEIAGEYEHN